MGQIDNVESDFPDQPGPSGYVTRVHDMYHSDQRPEIDKTHKKRLNPFQLFAEQVSISGIREAYEADLFPVRIMFRIALIIFFALITYQAIAIIKLIARQGTVIDFFEVIEDVPPFPNVSICYPLFINGTIWNQAVTEILATDKRAMALYQLYNFTALEIMEFMKGVPVLKTTIRNIGTPLYLLAKMIYDSATEGNTNRFIKSLNIPDCKFALANCAMDGVEFDCCQQAIPMTNAFSVCYQIELNQPALINSTMPKIDNRALTMHVSTNWENGYFDDDQSASDGFHIFIDRVPTQFSVPVLTPSGMDVSVVLGQPSKLEQLVDCIPNSNAPKLKYYDYYDTHGEQCCWDKLIDKYKKFIGCLMPGISFFPINESCTFAPMMTAYMILSTMGSTNDEESVFSFADKRTMKTLEAKVMADREEIATLFRRKKSPCKPLCSRWDYPVFSVSYGAIQYRNQTLEQQELANRSWSRLKISLPYTSAISHTEQSKMSAFHMAISKIGGMTSVYVGFSMITIAEILAYGAQIVVHMLKRRKKAVSPMALGGLQLGIIVAPMNLNVNEVLITESKC